MQQKQQETLEHLYMSLKSLLIILQDLRKEKSDLINLVMVDIDGVMNNFTKPDMITIKTMIRVIQATPILMIRRNEELILDSRELNNTLIDQMFRLKKQQDLSDFNESLVKRWIKVTLLRIEVSQNEQELRLRDYIDKLFELLGSVKQLVVADEEDNKKKEEKEQKEVKEKPKVFLLGADDETPKNQNP